jgi:2-keto-4-pentenoate hydratase/2-oxohepta-3-ene-1,7-dioic acid hydratase in catechol pathway
MRFVRFFHNSGEIRLGLRQEDTILDLTAFARRKLDRQWSSVTALMNGELGLLQELIADGSYEFERIRNIESLKLDAPIRDIPKLLALAGNFRKHVVESGFRDVQKEEIITPQVFCKPPSTTVNRPGGEIALYKSNVFLDWEVEFACSGCPLMDWAQAVQGPLSCLLQL